MKWFSVAEISSKVTQGHHTPRGSIKYVRFPITVE